MITHCLISKLDRDLENKQNKFLPFLTISLLKSLTIDLNLFNMSNFLKKTHNPLSLAIYLLETLMIKSKQFNRMNSLNKKQSPSSIFNNVFKIYYNRLNSLN